MATDSGGGWWTATSILTYGAIRNRSSAPAEVHPYNSIAADVVGARFPPASSLTSVSLRSRRLHFHGWLPALIAHRFVGNTSQTRPGLPLFLFLSRTLDPLCLPSALLKCNGKQTRGCYLMAARKTILRDWRRFITCGSGREGWGVGSTQGSKMR